MSDTTASNATGTGPSGADTPATGRAMAGRAAGTTTAPKKGRFRENVDAFAIAILMAILMKYFAIEAYQIPTSSMQPTMMGHKETGVFDRIIVDKLRYEIVEPSRWDIVVFRYPIRIKQNYVKRLVGMPGDKLRIAGGNVYEVVGSDPQNPEHLRVLRRPPSVQEQHWKELHPARFTLHGGKSLLAEAFRRSSGRWSEDADGRLTVEQLSDSSTVAMTFTNDRDGGLVDRVYDGYPADIARAMLQESGPVESVQDARFGFTIAPRAAVKQLEVQIAVYAHGGRTLRFQLVATDGRAHLAVEDGTEVAARSEPFDLPLAAGSSTHVRFAHVDDQCHAWIGGELVATLDTDRFKTLAPLRPSSTGNEGRVTLRLSLRGGDTVVLSDLRVERDLHYLTSSRPGSYSTDPIDVPEGHYLMLGDNTQQSVDSRDWTSITIGATSDGKLVDPRSPGAHTLTGNMRVTSLHEPPDPDENPVIVDIGGRSRIVFTDHIGEVWVLDGQIAMDTQSGRMYGPGSAWFEGRNGPWEAPQAPDQFVRREHIIGRPVLNFWPWYRIGFIR